MEHISPQLLTLFTTLIAVGGTLFSVHIAQNRTDKRELQKDRESRRIARLTRQLEEFYSPCLGIIVGLIESKAAYRKAWSTTADFIEFAEANKDSETVELLKKMQPALKVKAQKHFRDVVNHSLQAISERYQQKIEFVETSTLALYESVVSVITMSDVWLELDEIYPVLYSTNDEDEAFENLRRDFELHKKRLIAEIEPTKKKTKRGIIASLKANSRTSQSPTIEMLTALDSSSFPDEK